MKLWGILLILLISGCATQSVNQSSIEFGDLTLVQQQILLGHKALTEGVTWQAIENYDEAIRLCEEEYKESDEKLYSARGMTDNIYYLLLAASNEEEAIVVSQDCPDAYFYRGYTSVEVGDIEAAENNFSKALDYSPVNALYLSEYGNIFHLKKDWQKALDVFYEAELAAETYSPEELKDRELCRAKRGVGFSLVELGQLENAELKFKECLEIDPNDEGSIWELKYIEKLKSEG